MNELLPQICLRSYLRIWSRSREFSQDSIPTNRISFALRASEISEDDLETISDINRIALNLNFMARLLGVTALIDKLDISTKALSL